MREVHMNFEELLREKMSKARDILNCCEDLPINPLCFVVLKDGSASPVMVGMIDATFAEVQSGAKPGIVEDVDKQEIKDVVSRLAKAEAAIAIIALMDVWTSAAFPMRPSEDPARGQALHGAVILPDCSAPLCIMQPYTRTAAGVQWGKENVRTDWNMFGFTPWAPTPWKAA
jgi:hypothetical protein